MVSYSVFFSSFHGKTGSIHFPPPPPPLPHLILYNCTNTHLRKGYISVDETPVSRKRNREWK